MQLHSPNHFQKLRNHPDLTGLWLQAQGLEVGVVGAKLDFFRAAILEDQACRSRSESR
jgi:hypothetical protein